MNKIKPTLVLGLALVFAALPILQPMRAHAFTPNLVMDDVVFDDVNSMSAAQIDSWLNANFPNSCISTNHGFSAPDPTGYSPSAGYTYGGNVSAGQVIYDSAHAYDINPQVLLTTLQKEQSLVTGGAGCSTLAYAAATGYGCPDGGTTYNYSGLNLYTINGAAVTSVSGTCVNTGIKAGFSQQVIRAAWLLKFGEQRSEGNIQWAIIRGSWNNSDDPESCYGGPMTQGTFARCPSGSAAYYDGYTVIDGSSTHMDTGATAALYWYTPHFSGNQHFVTIFSGWFGGTVSASYFSCHNASNVSGASTGQRIASDSLGGRRDTMSLVIPNNTSTACVEVHTWANTGYQQWVQHIATNYPAVNPATSKILFADTNGDGQDEAYLVNYTGTASGMIEVHGWDSTYYRWAEHIATNRPVINPADAEIIAADTNGDGKDELYLVQYRNTASGRVEIHGWSSNLQQWVSHVATNFPTVDPATSRIIAGDINGDGKEEFILVQYQNTSTGMIELHAWTPDLQQWVAHIATNRPSAAFGDNEVITADTNGDGRDEFYFVQYHGTASGRVEIHGWTPNFQQWWSHVATSEGAF